jgi:hypothetical protein
MRYAVQSLAIEPGAPQAHVSMGVTAVHCTAADTTRLARCSERTRARRRARHVRIRWNQAEIAKLCSGRHPLLVYRAYPVARWAFALWRSRRVKRVVGQLRFSCTRQQAVAATLQHD